MFEDFALRANKQKLRLAIAQSRDAYIEKLPERLSESIESLGKRMGEVLVEGGYKDFSKEDIVIEEKNYGQIIGICAFLEAEKFDDIRGFLLASFNKTEELYKEVDRLHERIKELEGDPTDDMDSDAYMSGGPNWMGD